MVTAQLTSANDKLSETTACKWHENRPFQNTGKNDNRPLQNTGKNENRQNTGKTESQAPAVTMLAAMVNTLAWHYSNEGPSLNNNNNNNNNDIYTAHFSKRLKCA